jgi:uncharacterized membrane-anchored protein
MNNQSNNSALGKVPEVTLLFWVMKIAATTVGETGGDMVSMSMNLGYLVSTAIFAVIFLAAVIVQVKARAFHPYLYWFTIIATTTVGTTLADFCDRSLGVGYAGGSSLLFILLMTSLFAWYKTLGTVAVDSVSEPRSEMFYWLTIMFSQTLGTALGDWTADSEGMGYLGGATLFIIMLAVVFGLYKWTRVSRTTLFWSAFILTRPLGAVLGDFLDKPIAQGGLNLSRYAATAALLLLILACIRFFEHRPAKKTH